MFLLKERVSGFRAVGLLALALFFAGGTGSGTFLSEKIHSWESYVGKSLVGLWHENTTALGAFSEEEAPRRITLGNIDDETFTPLKEGRTVRVNLITDEITTYTNGRLVATYPILGEAKPDSRYAPLGGEYYVLGKEEEHLLSEKKTYLPYDIQFFGNASIHGWPYSADTKKTPVGKSFQGDSVRISTEDAQNLFSFVDDKTRISVLAEKSLSEDNVEAPGYFLINSKKKPASISARSYVVGDLDTGEIVMEKNKDVIYPIASVTKLITALLATEPDTKDTSVTISKNDIATEGSNGGLRAGETLTAEDLTYPLLLESSNDAGTALARALGGNSFIERMNAYTLALGMTNSSFDEPTGLSSGDTSTGGDLFRLARHLFLDRQDVLTLTTEKQKSADGHSWYNTSQFLRTDGYLGGKRGYTDPALETQLGVFSLRLSEFDTRHLGIIVLGSVDRYRDVTNLLSYLRSNVYYGGDESEIAFYTPPPPPPIPKDTTLVFGGDIMLDRGVRTSVENNYGGDYSALFAPLTKLADADIAFANLEGDVSDVGHNVGSKYSFRMDPQVIPVMKDAGIDIVSFANNHVGDWSKEAFDDTRRRLSETEILYTGAGDTSAKATEPVIIEHNGTRFGFLGATDVGPDWLLATPTSSGVLLASNPDLPTIIANAKKKVDFLILSFHWGTEYVPATDRQKTLAHMAIDAGANLVVGHHPHVIEESEWYNGGYILYSLGNLIFDQYFSTETMQGLLAEITVDNGTIVAVKKNLVRLDPTYRPESITDYEY